MTTQISELGRGQRRGRAVTPVSDRAAVTTDEPAVRIALTQQEACTSLGGGNEFFRGARSSTSSGCDRMASDAGEPDLAGKPCLYAAGTRAIGRSSQRTSPALMRASFVWRPRRFPGCLGALGSSYRDGAAPPAHKGRGGRVARNERGALRALRAAVCEGCAVRPITADRAWLARSLGKRACSLRQRRRVSAAPRGRSFLRGRSPGSSPCGSGVTTTCPANRAATRCLTNTARLALRPLCPPQSKLPGLRR